MKTPILFIFLFFIITPTQAQNVFCWRDSNQHLNCGDYIPHTSSPKSVVNYNKKENTPNVNPPQPAQNQTKNSQQHFDRAMISSLVRNNNMDAITTLREDVIRTFDKQIEETKVAEASPTNQQEINNTIQNINNERNQALKDFDEYVNQQINFYILTE